MKYLQISFVLFTFVTLLASCGSEPVELSDHEWKVTEVTGSSATKETMENLSLIFKEGQEIGGFAGCNDYRGGATYNQEQIKFSTLYADNESCDYSSLEKRFLSNLESSVSYTYNAGKLILYDEGGNILVEMEKN
ncbi:META domain-containing protein [Cyclobacterium sp.]|uniref:META domain-containing protein n=1 Tax=Cyclobacterium sp. TaxID=1966343 RepID=UPI00198C800D|nr:META domain-containing protein [Cyclobacterium sp.]MBD3629206.1 META domain-containing protein [Cyclobacterium sp.]